MGRNDFKKEDSKFWITIASSAVITLMGALCSYFNALADIKKEISLNRMEDFRAIDEKYISRDEFNLIIKSLDEIKYELRSIRKAR